jgi:ribosomal protein L32
MRRGKRIQIYATNCKRCGKPIHATTSSFYGANSLHAKYSRICSDCTTPEEKQEILNGTANAILRSRK